MDLKHIERRELAGGFNLGCDPATLVSGGTFQTPLQCFENAAGFGHLAFRIIVDISEFTPNNLDPHFERITEGSSIYPTKLARTVLSLLIIAARDCNLFVRSDIFTKMWITYQLNDDLTMFPTWTTVSGPGWIGNHPEDYSMALESYSQIIIHNYFYVLWAGILADMGSTSKLDLLANITTMRRFIQDYPLRDNTKGPTFIYDNLSMLGLPVDPVQPTHLTTRYLCRHMAWKPILSLLVDVIVATLSLFMAYWATLALILGYYARNYRSNGKFLICTYRMAL
ncbi:hypothetical protein BDV93DRAFT_545523 [Ceratobasidium sp. AG-I]|nr:hypothetical protein BDV93DRAFT_545523 [Ceratobasidium sp. AG-I]